ncbi:MAG: response regulator, partial [Cyclobacteriaceae bacterium]
MKALVVDDSRLARNELKRLLKDFDNIQVVGEAANAMEATEKIDSEKPDLVFLDIQMPGKNGFELLEELEVTPDVIFTTAYDEYAIKAFEYNALDYLLKPVQKDRLAGAINKVLEKKEKFEDHEGERIGIDD